jgi:hypothetical protein
MGDGSASKFQMSEDLADHLALCNGGNDPQRPALAKRAAGQLQRKHPLEQSRPALVQRRRAGLLCLHALLARRRDNRLSQRAMQHSWTPGQNYR